MQSDKTPFPGIQVKGYRSPRLRARRGPFCQGLEDSVFPLLQSVLYFALSLPQIGDGLLHTKRRREDSHFAGGKIPPNFTKVVARTINTDRNRYAQTRMKPWVSA